MSIPHRNYLAD